MPQPTETQRQMSQLLDELTLAALNKLKASNEPITPAMITAITKRLSTDGIAPAETPGSDINKIRQQVKESRPNAELPPLRITEDDRATA